LEEPNRNPEVRSDIPLSPTDESYGLVRNVDENLHKLKRIPMLICWGKHDFVFDTSYLAEWQRRFPNAEVHLFSDAGHYVLEDEPENDSNPDYGFF
jgi:haloalkane dehalogenase